jgi:hypothetical protein
MVDLEWNRKTIFEKLDWLKDTLEDVISKANRNVSVHREQLRALTERLATLEKPARESVPATTSQKKKRQRAPPRRPKRQPLAERNR